ncbi:MAG: hypothetical protein AUI84_07050 [Delftia sp. 13_1_40CM_3_66_6]|nr:MAG: hypothetical protein AUI84_07050 [Delftia sp. 13_1_40CM_3_66_6]
MEADPNRENVVRMIGSSTERDLQGDTMALSALTDMAQVDPGMSIWLNHRYSLPESLFGSLLEKPELRLQGGIADLHIVSDVTPSNPDAIKTYGYIKEGRRMGCSIGCIILEYEIDEENDDGRSWWPPLIILHVLPLEWSVVGIPANQRSWVENAIRGLFERSLTQGKGDEALKLAPAMRGLYPRAFTEKLKDVNDQSLLKDLEKIKPRAMPDQRIEWEAPRKVFTLNRMQKGAWASTDIGRNEVTALLEKGIGLPLHTEKTMIGWDPATGPGSAVLVKSDGDGNVLEVKPLAEGEVVEPDKAKEEQKATLLTNNATGSTEVAEVIPLKEYDEGIAEAGEPCVTSEEKKAEALKSIEEAEERWDREHEIPLISGYSPETVTLPKGVEPLAELDKARFESIAGPLDVQLFNALAARLGQSQIALDGNGEIVASKAFPELSPESVQETIAKALDIVEATKAGNKLSKENRGHVQACHDALVSMAGTQWDPCEGLDGSSDGEETDEEGAKDIGIVSSAKFEQLLTEQSAKFDAFVDALATHGIDPNALKDLQGEIKDAQRQAQVLQGQIQETEDAIAKLKDMPLGQPTMLKRSVKTGQDVATYQDFAGIRRTTVRELNVNERRWTLAEALEQTTVISRTLPGGETLNYRKWPEGVGGSVQAGVRPELTGAQRQWMHPMEMLSYSDGNEAAVPCYDDPCGVKA